MYTQFFAAAFIALSITSCKTASPANDSNLESSKKSKIKRFVCTLSNDSVSKEFRPKEMTKDIQVTIATNTINKVSIEIGKKGKAPTKATLKSISGDEGYTEFTVPAAIEKTYGFSFVNVSYNSEDVTSDPVSATLINGGDFRLLRIKL